MIPEGKEPDVVAGVRSHIRFRKRQLSNEEFQEIVEGVS
jgi:hypothetical protein